MLVHVQSRHVRVVVEPPFPGQRTGADPGLERLALGDPLRDLHEHDVGDGPERPGPTQPGHEGVLRSCGLAQVFLDLIDLVWLERRRAQDRDVRWDRRRERIPDDRAGLLEPRPIAVSYTHLTLPT